MSMIPEVSYVKLTFRKGGYRKYEFMLNDNLFTNLQVD